MKIKSYRAETLRAALMQIKEELGEDALVLETKRVRAGGLFGVGARDLVEVRVAPNPYQSENTQAENAQAAAQTRAPRLDLTDDSDALPTSTAGKSKNFERANGFQMDEQSLKAFSTLAARAYSAEADAHAPEPPPQRKTALPIPTRRSRDYASSRVEIAETAPRIIHPRGGQPRNGQPRGGQPAGMTRPTQPRVPQAQAQAQQPRAQQVRPPQASMTMPPPPPVTFPAQSPNAAFNHNAQHSAGKKPEREAVDTELAGLRAELREMKLALGAFAARSATPSDERDYSISATPSREPMFVQGPDYDMFQGLRSVGVAVKLAQQAVKQARGLGESTDIDTRTRMALIAALPTWMNFAESAMPLQEVIAFIGATGVGKTTTIAKLAAHIALRAKQRVELVTLDTYRIAAVQQLKTYAEIIGAGCHIAHSVKELDAIIRRFAGVATVMIDTTGRSPHDLADQFELADYLRLHPQILKCLVLTATSHPEDARLALDKFALYGANRLALTKLDETVQPGATISMAAAATLPLMYLCAGQRVPEDLERATPATFAQRVLRPRVMAQAA